MKTKSKSEEHTTQEVDVQNSKLMKLFEEELKDIYWAEKKLTDAIPKMIENATSGELKTALKNHLKETEGHVKRVEQVFEILGEKATAQKCKAMAGLTDEAEELMSDCEEGAMRDAGIIAAGQKVEHYEMASYGTLIQYAKTLHLKEAAGLLEQTLKEEKAADKKLSEIAVGSVNEKAASEDGIGL